MLQSRPPLYPSVATRADLLALGLTPHRITSLVRAGTLIRPRRDRYLPASSTRDVVAAVGAGGKVTCTSALAAAGIWVQHAPGFHIHIAPGSSRLRQPFTGKPLQPRSATRDFTLHWRTLVVPEDSDSAAVGIVDALIDALLCQSPDFAVASLDSALRFGLVSSAQLDVVFFHLPKQLQHLRSLIDIRSESVIETLFRLQLKRMRLPFELQVKIPGVGRVDFIVAGRIVVETDGEAYHGEQSAARDYDRDLRLVARGYIVIRLNYRQVVFEPDRVAAALRAAMTSHRPLRAAAPS